MPTRGSLAIRSTLLAGALAAGAMSPAHAGWLDSIFGKGSTKPDAPAAARPDSRNRSWQLHEFTSIKLVPREPGSEPNQHPVRIDAEALRAQLAVIQVVTGKDGSRASLFDTGELNELVPILAKALATATPADDILLLSADRREGGFIGQPQALTARMFVDANGLQLIVHDARQEFYDAYRGANIQPHFIFGMRGTAGSAQLSSVGGTTRRPDWLTIPMNVSGARLAAEQPPAPIGAAGAAAVPAPIAPAAVMAAPAPVAPAPLAAVPAAVAPAPLAAAPAAAAAALSEPERRLETLKRLHGKGLITDQEYEEKRKEILKSL